MTAVFVSYVAGLLTTLNPCVLPMLPIVLAGTMVSGRAGPLVFAAGMVSTFTAAGLFIATVGIGLGITPQILRSAAAVMFVLFGLVLLIGPLQMRLALATSGLATAADSLASRTALSGLARPLFIGALAGAMWAPCSGPSLGAAIALATEAGDLAAAAVRMVAFGFGAATVLIALAYGSRATVAGRRDRLLAATTWIKPAAGILFVAVGIAVLTGFDKTLESRSLDHLPDWFTDLTTRF